VPRLNAIRDADFQRVPEDTSARKSSTVRNKLDTVAELQR
jgi:hypothetical protein